MSSCRVERPKAKALGYLDARTAFGGGAANHYNDKCRDKSNGNCNGSGRDKSDGNDNDNGSGNGKSKAKAKAKTTATTKTRAKCGGSSLCSE
jgi:hypothetical protein